MPNGDPTPGPVSEADLRVIADKMGAFGIDIENVTLTSAGLDVDGPHRVTTIADLASALLAAREALREACDWLEAEVDLAVENGTTGGHADDYRRLAALRACLPEFTTGGTA